MRSMIFGLVAALTAGSSALAVEESVYQLNSAGDLAALCGAPEDPRAIQMCQGFLVGVDRMHSAVKASLGEGIYCLPSDGTVTRNTAATAYAAWYAATPEVQNFTALDGLLRWASTTYPCPATK